MPLCHLWCAHPCMPLPSHAPLPLRLLCLNPNMGFPCCRKSFARGCSTHAWPMHSLFMPCALVAGSCRSPWVLSTPANPCPMEPLCSGAVGQQSSCTCVCPRKPLPTHAPLTLIPSWARAHVFLRARESKFHGADCPCTPMRDMDPPPLYHTVRDTKIGLAEPLFIGFLPNFEQRLGIYHRSCSPKIVCKLVNPNP